MHTVYAVDINDEEGYKSNFTVNTQNLEGTYRFNVNYTVFDATADANSNVEILEGSQYDLNVNAVAATRGNVVSYVEKVNTDNNLSQQKCL